uniref:CTD nuclear envelope phosphatase 1 regulatory subunit 1 n=1 Tax=Cyanistes caeruleus TaxID=156563 RepID=A0A8C0VCP2_CYACU
MFVTLILFFISDFDSGISLHSNWGLELVNRPRDTKGIIFHVTLESPIFHN